MSARTENRGRRRTRRSAHDEDEKRSNGDNNNHHHHYYHHDRAAHRNRSSSGYRRSRCRRRDRSPEHLYPAADSPRQRPKSSFSPDRYAFSDHHDNHENSYSHHRRQQHSKSKSQSHRQRRRRPHSETTRKRRRRTGSSLDDAHPFDEDEEEEDEHCDDLCDDDHNHNHNSDSYRRRSKPRRRRHRSRSRTRRKRSHRFSSSRERSRSSSRRSFRKRRQWRSKSRSRSRSRGINEHDRLREHVHYSRSGSYPYTRRYEDERDSFRPHSHSHQHQHQHPNPPYHQAPHQQPFVEGAAAGSPRHPHRSGVVSDDDDGNSNTHVPNPTGSTKQSVHTATTATATTPSHAHRDDCDPRPPNVTGTKNTPAGSPAANENKENNSNNKKEDDTVGHFQGREGCVVADRYRILREVGMGTFGRVVECLDIQRRRGRRHDREDDDRYGHRRESEPPRHNDHCRDTVLPSEKDKHVVAIKIVRNIKRYYDSAKIEADIIEDVNRHGQRGVTHCAILYDTFSFQGHYCMVFEALGPSLYDFLKGQKYHPFPIHCVRDFAQQLLETLEFLHSFRLIHTDLKPENILLLNGRKVPQRGGYSIPESTRIKVIDFGGATYDNEKKGSIVNTRQYRAPEVILGVGWSMPSDLWSVGCILAELYQGELLFATHDNTEHLALIERIVGPFPRAMLRRAKNVAIVDAAFDSSGSHRMERVLPADQFSYVKRTAPLESILAYDEDAWFLRLLRRILVIDPDQRATARECLRKF